MLGEKDINKSFTKEKVLGYIYNVYIKNGYYIHGYSSVYTGVIKEEGFVTEIYNNLYPNFIKMQKILKLMIKKQLKLKKKKNQLKITMK